MAEKKKRKVNLLPAKEMNPVAKDIWQGLKADPDAHQFSSSERANCSRRVVSTVYGLTMDKVLEEIDAQADSYAEKSRTRQVLTGLRQKLIETFRPAPEATE